MKLEPNHVVSLTYDLYVNNPEGGESHVESATQEQPLTFLYGAGQMLPKFEEELSTLATGDKFDFRLAAADAYGEYNNEAVASLPKEMFQGADMPEVGAILPLQDNQGGQFQGQVVSVVEDGVLVDLNHPMAGQDLHFKGEIINVRPANPEELQHGHAHGSDGHHHE